MVGEALASDTTFFRFCTRLFLFFCQSTPVLSLARNLTLTAKMFDTLAYYTTFFPFMYRTSAYTVFGW